MRVAVLTFLASVLACTAACRDTERVPINRRDAGPVTPDRDGGDVQTPRDGGRDGGQRPASGQIQMVLDAPTGTLATPQLVEGAIVTDVRPALGDDPEGFFCQADVSGPALFVSIANLVPAVGDIITFEVTETAMIGEQHAVTAIGTYRVDSSGYNVTLLLQDISGATNVADDPGAYDGELVSFFGTAGPMFTPLNGSQQRISVGTTGVPNDARFSLRVADAVIDAEGLAPGCSVTIGPAPLLARSSGPEIFLWSGADIVVTDCDGPFRVGAARSSGPTSVVIDFNRPVLASSVMASAFSFAPALNVTAAAASERRVTLTTDALTNDTTYTVTVDGTVMDIDNQSLEAGSNMATFTTGGAPGGGLVINEVDYDQPGGDTTEFVELYNGTASAVSLANLALVFVNGNTDAEYLRVDLSQAGSLEAGGYLVLGNATIASASFVLEDSTVQNGAPDGIALVNTQTQEVIDAVSYEGRIESAALDGFGRSVELTSGTTLSARDNGDGSIARLPNGADSGDDDVDWGETATPTPGGANVP
ncbi:MAG: lamin tail domain-containing protein [Deltaproteobacteria bacterium]